MMNVIYINLIFQEIRIVKNINLDINEWINKDYTKDDILKLENNILKNISN